MAILIYDMYLTLQILIVSSRLWSVPKPYEVDIIESLENKYGELEDKSSLGLAIKSVSKILVEDNMQDYLEDLKF